MAWLHMLPDMLVFPIIIGPLVAAVVAAPYVRHRLMPRTSPPPLNSEMMDAFIALASSAAILLTFSLVQAESSFRHIEEQVAKEAATLNDLDRTVLRYGDQRLLEVRQRLVEYGETIISDEWRYMHTGGRSREADALYTTISKTIGAIEPETHRQQLMFAEALKQADELSDLREERLEAATLTLPGTYWFTTLTMIALMIAMAARNEQTRERMWITGSIAGAIGLLTALVVIFDAPFQGDGSVPHHAFEKVLEQMAVRT